MDGTNMDLTENESRNSSDTENDEGFLKLLNFTPVQASVHGGQNLFITCGGQCSSLENDALHYVVFEGSKLRHLTSAKLINPFTLQAIIPGHDIAETVNLSIACRKDGESCILSKGTFTYTLDTTFLLAQSLAMNSGNAVLLQQLETLYSSLFLTSPDQLAILDNKLASAFKQMKLEKSWSLVGENADWTLLHLCAKYGMTKLAEFLIVKRGAAEALDVEDKHGRKPADVARNRQNIALVELFSRTPQMETMQEEENAESCKPIVKRHKLGSTTVTSSNAQRSVEQDAILLEDLQNLAMKSRKGPAAKEAKHSNAKTSHPLAHSLQKLREINLEIQRLRCLTQSDEQQADDLFEERRARSFSCPDSFTNSRNDKNRGFLHHSLSLSSWDENASEYTVIEKFDEAEPVCAAVESSPEKGDDVSSGSTVNVMAEDDVKVQEYEQLQIDRESTDDIAQSSEEEIEENIGSSKVADQGLQMQLEDSIEVVVPEERSLEHAGNSFDNLSEEVSDVTREEDVDSKDNIEESMSLEPVGLDDQDTSQNTDAEAMESRYTPTENETCELEGKDVSGVTETVDTEDDGIEIGVAERSSEEEVDVLASDQEKDAVDGDENHDQNDSVAEVNEDVFSDSQTSLEQEETPTEEELCQTPTIKEISLGDAELEISGVERDSLEGVKESCRSDVEQVGQNPPQQSYDEEDAGENPPQQSYDEEDAGKNPPQQSCDEEEAGKNPPQQSYDEEEPGKNPPQQSYDEEEAGKNPPQQSYGGEEIEQNPSQQSYDKEEAVQNPSQQSYDEETGQNPSQQSYEQQDFPARSNNNIVQESRLLTAVTEETEEELLEFDGKIDGECHNHHGKSHSLEEIKNLKSLEQRMHHSAEQVYFPREVVVLRRGILKKDRPLSDNYENIKMIDRENRLNRLSKHSDSDESVSGLDKRKSKSLDALLMDDDNLKSPSLTSSQLSIESLQSMDALEVSGSPLYRTKSAGSSTLDHRASLNDICLSVRDETEGPAPLSKKKRSRFSFKRKSKSTTALDKREPEVSNEDRRRTIIGGISSEKILAARTSLEKNQRRIFPEKSKHRNRDSGIDSTCELRLEDIILSTPSNLKDTTYMRSVSENSGNYLHPSRDRNRTSSEISGDSRDTEDEIDADTDEGTSSEIAEKVRKSSICTEEKKKEKKFGLLRKPKKDKKHHKDKEKDVIDVKSLKKSHKEGKASFLGKKPSFRQGSRPVSTASTLSVDSKMFARASSMGKSGSAAKHSSSMDNLRGSGRGYKVSPSANRRTVHEVDGIADAENSLTNLNTLGALSSSRTSLDSLSLEELVDAPYQVDDLYQYDSDLDIKNEPSTWSDLVEKKVQRKLHAKDIKRQDVIYELIATESNYVRTLKIVSRIYCVGFRKELGLDEQTITDLFPRLTDLLEINETFCKQMKKRQEESNNNVIEDIGDILLGQFGGAKGEFMKEVYGYFCSRHLQAVALYKDLMKTDKKFAVFVKKCMLNERVRRLSIPECITLATQRLTKYPLLIEAIIKATKESKSDYENLKKSLQKVKEVLMAVDDYVREYEKEQELGDIRKRFDARGEVQYKNGQTFKNSKLFNRRSKLIHDGVLTWKGKKQSVEARAVLLADKFFFLQEKDQRLNLLSIDSKAPVIYVKNLIVREVATDMKALFLVNNEGPEIYELVCPSAKTKMKWINMIMDAIKNKPDDEDENQSDLEEEMRKEEEMRILRLKDIMEQMQVTDNRFVHLVADKNRLVVEMRELIEKMVSSSKDNSTSNLDLKATDVLEGRETLEKAILEASSLTSLLCDGEIAIQHSTTSPSASQIALTAPKRAETFGGFDRNPKTLAPPSQVSRASSLKQDNRLSLIGKPPAQTETDYGGKDPKERVRKTSQGLMSVIGRNKPMGSTEDLSSSSSISSQVPLTNTTAQRIMAVMQLKDYLTSLMDVTNKQDIELASIRVELHQSRSEILKLRTERQGIEERFLQQQKEHERQMSRQKESYAKLEREFKRTVEKFNKQLNEHKYQQQLMMEKYTELQKFVQGTQNNSKSNKNSLSLSSLRNKHHTMQTGDNTSASNSELKRTTNSSEELDNQDVIFF